MKLALAEWIAMSKATVKVCDGAEDVTPKAIFIGTLKEDGVIESRLRLVSASEWEKFREIWKWVSEQNNSICKECLPNHPPQFFLFYE